MKQITIFLGLLLVLFAVKPCKAVNLTDNNNIASEASSPEGNELFLDYPFIGTGYGFVPTTPSIPGPGVFKPYVPEVVIDETKIIWVSPNGNGTGELEVNPTTINAALATASNQEGTTIVALDGTYNLNIAITQMVNVNLISKNKWGAILNGSGGQIFTFTDHATIHEFNIIGFQGTNTPGGGYFIFGSGIMTDYNVYNVYLSDLKLYDLQVAIYGGLHSHDWTVDRTIHYNSTASYLWYMMGWHQSVINSTLYNNTYYSLSIRGCYPPDEAYLLDENYNSVHGQTPISTRTEHFLAENDWTHLIINNTFGSNYSYTRNADGHIGIYYNADEGDISEYVYFPPRNIHIMNNAFIDKGAVAKVGVVVFADRGINDPDQTNIASINGIFIKNNYVDRTLVNAGSGATDITNITYSANVENVNEDGFGFDDDNRDYKLTATSVLINQGTAEPFAPNNDMEGVTRSGLPDVGTFEFSSPLPIEFLDFSARMDKADVLLQWATTFEKNNHGFDVLHSIDGRAWEKLSFVNGAGNSSQKLDYKFKHSNPSVGINYYRLKQYDVDGNYTFSSIQEVNIVDKLAPNVYPSPIKRDLSISNFKGRGYIYNVVGQLVMEFACDANQTMIDTQVLPKGTYQLLLVSQRGERIAQLLMKN